MAKVKSNLKNTALNFIAGRALMIQNYLYSVPW